MASSIKDADAKNTTLVEKSHIYCSEPFKFLIGDQAIYVHADLITKYSEPLDRMIHGSYVEAKQGLATLEEVDLNTFLRFVQWLYHGYYDAASPRSLTASEKYQTPERVQSDHSFDYAAPSRDYEDPEPVENVTMCRNSEARAECSCFRQYSPKESFIQRRYTVRNIKKDAPQPRPNSNKQEEYSEVFLGHARLYVFADKYDVTNLKVLAMEELHATLAVYTLYQERTGDVVALLRYVYANTADSKDGVEDLRTILTQYMETEIDTLIKDEDLQEVILQDGGPLLADLMKVMGKKLA